MPGTPPHRSRRALLTHRAPASGIYAKTLFLTPPVPSPALFPGLSGSVSSPCFTWMGSPGQPPSLHLLRRPLVVTNFVRWLPRYYGVVRLPAAVHHGRTLLGSPCGPFCNLQWPATGSPDSRPWCFRAISLGTLLLTLRCGSALYFFNRPRNA